MTMSASISLLNLFGYWTLNIYYYYYYYYLSEHFHCCEFFLQIDVNATDMLIFEELNGNVFFGYFTLLY